MLTIDLNSQKMIAKAREEGVETMYDRKEGFKAQWFWSSRCLL